MTQRVTEVAHRETQRLNHFTIIPSPYYVSKTLLGKFIGRIDWSLLSKSKINFTFTTFLYLIFFNPQRNGCCVRKKVSPSIFIDLYLGWTF